MPNLYEETKNLIRKYNISANKNLGQNFLIDEQVLEAIIDSSEICSDDVVIEVGPGLGTLTKELLKKAGKVIAVELDSKMVQVLNNRFIAEKNFEIINEDILKVDLNKIIKNEKEKNGFKKVKVVANLPYYITTPIIIYLLENNLKLDLITVMIQKEVADRITATPGSKMSGAITYFSHYYSEPKSVMVVANTSFIPQPKVDSEVITLKILEQPSVNVENKQLFFNIIKANFTQRRKTFVNALVNAKIVNSKEDAKKILNQLNINENVRGETLSMQEYEKVANFLNKR